MLLLKNMKLAQIAVQIIGGVLTASIAAVNLKQALNTKKEGETK